MSDGNMIDQVTSNGGAWAMLITLLTGIGYGGRKSWLFVTATVWPFVASQLLRLSTEASEFLSSTRQLMASHDERLDKANAILMEHTATLGRIEKDIASVKNHLNGETHDQISNGVH